MFIIKALDSGIANPRLLKREHIPLSLSVLAGGPGGREAEARRGAGPAPTRRSRQGPSARRHSARLRGGGLSPNSSPGSITSDRKVPGF